MSIGWQIVLLSLFSLLCSAASYGTPVDFHRFRGKDSLFYKKCAAQLIKYQERNKNDFEGKNSIIYSLDDLVAKAKAQNLDLKINAEKVYQARENIKVSIGRLFPRLIFSGIVNGLSYQEYYDVAAALLGFLFPSNWFRWSESKLYFEAERRSHAALIGNQINIVASLYYYIANIKTLLAIYKDLQDKVSYLVNVSEIRIQLGEDRIDTVIRIQNIKNQIKQDRRAVDNELRKLFYNLGFALNEPVDAWNDLDVAEVRLPNLKEAQPLDIKKLLVSAYENSLELEQFDYLVLASQYSVKNRYFEFLDPMDDGDGAFGFGYTSHIKIGKSMARQIYLERDRVHTQLSLAVYRALEDYQFAIESYKNATLGLERARRHYQFLLEKFEEGGEFDINEFIDALHSIFIYQTQQVNTQYEFLITNALIDRLILRGPYYKDLLSYTPQKPSLKLSFRKSIENRRIKKALKKGKLKLPKGRQSLQSSK